MDYTSVVTATMTEPTSPDDPLDADQAVIDRVLAGDRNAFGILIERYSAVIAADYAFTFLERNLRVGMAVLMKNYTLNNDQRRDMKLLSENARTLLTSLGQEKIALYGKVTKFAAIADTLEQIERQLRSSMPQHVIDMLGYQASFLTK